jgi:T5SS/PEP-CTERM-associated repeat protein
MKRSPKLLCVNALLLGMMGIPSLLQADTVITGDVTPLPWYTYTTANIGDTGSGTLMVDGGSKLDSYSGNLGASYTGNGQVRITGPGSEWNCQELGVGGLGNGTLLVEAGGRLSSSGGRIGVLGAVTITGPGSNWNSDGLGIGSGSLTVLDGGAVTTGTLLASLGDLHGDGTITATKGAVLDADLQFNASHGTQATIGFGTGGILTVTADGGSLGAGYSGLGSLAVAEGIVVSSYGGELAYRPGSIGKATISGSGSKWIVGFGDLHVGRYGRGTLRVENGGQVVNQWEGYLGFDDNSIGEAIITGNGSRWTNDSDLYIGYAGKGTLRVENGGQVVSHRGYLGGGYLVDRKNSIGYATVNDSGSKWTVKGNLHIGSTGNGMLRVEKGGQVRVETGSGIGDDGSAFLGDDASSFGEAVITDTGSDWTIGGDLYIGYRGRGTLRVENGGRVVSGTSYLGFSELNNDVTILGYGSKWICSDLLIGFVGQGALTITSDGLVEVPGALIIDRDSFINMSEGGMLALKGDADDSLAQFLALVDGTDAIRYWKASLSDWRPLTQAIFGVDYTLQYLTTGEFAGYTLLTVGSIPEPASLVLVVCLCVPVVGRRSNIDG